MRFLTTTRPPEGILAHDLGIEWAPPVFFRRDEPDPETAAGRVVAQILDAMSDGHRAITLRDWCNDAVMPVTENRDWWTHATEALAKQLGGLDRAPECIAVDHARYPSRRTPDEQRWLIAQIDALRNATDRLGLYGIHGVEPTVWTAADRYAWLDDDAYSIESIPWTIMPGQHRNQDGPPTVLEFAGVVHALEARGFDTCVVWSDPGVDAFGRWKTRPDHWHALLTVAALLRGRRVEVPAWEPPSWLPGQAEQPAKTPVRVFGEVQP